MTTEGIPERAKLIAGVAGRKTLANRNFALARVITVSSVEIVEALFEKFIEH